MGMPVGSAEVEGLKVPVDPQFPHRPVTAAQMQSPQKDGTDGALH